MDKERYFYEKDIENAYKDFCNNIIKQITLLGSLINIEKVTIELNLVDSCELYNRQDKKMYSGRYYFKKHYDAYVPNCESRGLYLFFNNKGIAVYVGMSTVSGGIGVRVCSHIGKKEGDLFPNLAFNDAEYVITIPFDECSGLGVAFETYLLENYYFNYNSIKQTKSK